jgi:hypothetical protein
MESELNVELSKNISIYNTDTDPSYRIFRPNPIQSGAHLRHLLCPFFLDRPILCTPDCAYCKINLEIQGDQTTYVAYCLRSDNKSYTMVRLGKIV